MATKKSMTKPQKGSTLTAEQVGSVEFRKRMRLEIQAVVMRKDRFLTFEKAAAWADERGFKLDAFQENPGDFLFTQNPRSLFDEASLQTVELFDGVECVVGVLKERPEDVQRQPTLEELMFDKLQGIVNAESPILSEVQAQALAGLREDLLASISGLKGALGKALPLLVEMAENLLSGPVGDQALAGLVDRMVANAQTMEGELAKIKCPAASAAVVPPVELVKMLADTSAQLEDAFEDTSFDRFHLLMKSCKLTFKEAAIKLFDAKPAQPDPQVEPEPVKKGMVPTKEMSREEKEAALQERSEHFGIEVTTDASLTFPAGFPEDLELFGDPVNLKFPIDTVARARNARVRFKQFANEIYQGENSKAVVHTRIVERALALGIGVELDEEDELDKLLPARLWDQAEGAEDEDEDEGEDTEKSVDKVVAAIEASTKEVVDTVSAARSSTEKSWFVPIRKLTSEQRIVMGVVLEPDVTDLQGHTYNEEEVQKAAWGFMEDYGHRGLMHEDMLEDDQVRILESFVAPVNMALPIDGGTFNIRKGTWLMLWRVKDDTLWEDVKQEKLTGFSIGGDAMMTNLRK